MLVPTEADMDESGNLNNIQINPASHLFRRCILNYQENRLLLHIEASIKRELAKEGLRVQINREDSLDYLESVKS